MGNSCWQDILQYILLQNQAGSTGKAWWEKLDKVSMPLNYKKLTSPDTSVL